MYTLIFHIIKIGFRTSQNLKYQDPRSENQQCLESKKSLSAGGKLRDRNDKELWALLEDLSLYENESWNDPRDFAKPVKAISLPQDVPSTSDRHLMELENQVQRLMKAYLAPKQPVQVNKITFSCEIYSGPHDTQYCIENPKQAFVDYASSHTDEAEGKWFTFKPEQNNLVDTYNPSWKSHPNLRKFRARKKGSAFVQGEMPKRMEDPGLFTLACGLGDFKPFDTLADLGIVRDVEVHIGKMKLLNNFYVIDIKKDPETPLLVGRGFLATVNEVIDCKKSKIAVRQWITRSVFRVKGIKLAREWEIARDAEINPFKDVLVFRRMVEFLGALPINLKRNVWESKDLIENLINWAKPPKSRDEAWHALIRIIDLDGKEFTKTLQSIPTSKKLSEKENPREIINLNHFRDT
nr:MAK10-like protein [Tanacetum cinerariifolium]